jgi:hypothetical protein
MKTHITFDHPRRNPGWLISMARKVRKLRRQIGLCCFYRSLNHGWREAWAKAGRTI